MEITPAGYIVLGSLLFLLFTKPTNILYLYIFCLPFTATAILNVYPNYGLQPGHLMGVILVILWILNFLIRHNTIIFSPINYPIFLFGIWAILSLTFPWIFEYQFQVLTQKGKITPLHFSRYNLTQLMFVLLFISLIIAQTDIFLRQPQFMQKALKVFVCSGMFVIIWGWIQFFMMYFALPYPAWLFNNSKSWIQRYTDTIGGIPRICSVFPESSMFSHFMAMYLPILFFMSFIHNQNSQRVTMTYRFFFVLGLLEVILSTSTSGIAAFVLMTILLLFINRPRLKFQFLSIPVITRKYFSFVMAIACLLIVLSVSWLGFSRTHDIFRNVVTQKLSSGSGEDRLYTSILGLRVFFSSFGLGAGWGSMRTTDLGTNLLCQTGIVGFGLFLFAFIGLIQKTYRDMLILKKRQTSFYPLNQGILIGFLACFGISFLSVPELNHPYMAFIWSIMVVVWTNPIIFDTGKKATVTCPQ
jgi:hypothetical protein